MSTALHQEEFDLIIVGASFAGLTCARSAALRGLRVLVLESKTDPGARVHTTGILVKEAADEIDIPAELTRPVHGVRLYSPSLKHIDLFSPGYYFLTTATALLLRWLAKEAERAGVQIRCDTRFRGATRHRDAFTIDGLDLKARYLVGADGARSKVSECFSLGRNRAFLTGVEAEFQTTNNVDNRYLHCFLDSQLAPGYLAWIAPAPGVIQVGLASNNRNKPDLERFRRKIQPLFQFDDNDIVERRSGVIPCSGIVKPFAAPSVLLIGDAAGMVSPLTAGGIQLAFRHGRRAGQLIADHLMRLGPCPELIMEQELPSFWKKSILRKILDTGPPNKVLDMMLNTNVMRQLAQKTYFHRRGIAHQSFEDYCTKFEQTEQLS